MLRRTQRCRGILTAGSSAFHLALNILFTLIALSVFLRGGEHIVAQLDCIGTRIPPGRWLHMLRVVPTTISATVTGMTLIAIGEGVILGIAYLLAGVPSPVVFGVSAGFMALIPGGAPLSFTLISAYLVFSGSTFAGIALFLWGTVELFIVDKTIRPVLIGGPVKLPFLATFFGLVGGVKTMGLVALLVDPILMALLTLFWRGWQRDAVTAAARQEARDGPGLTDAVWPSAAIAIESRGTAVQSSPRHIPPVLRPATRREEQR